MAKGKIALVAILITAGGLVYWWRKQGRPIFVPAISTRDVVSTPASQTADQAVSLVAQGLDTPWAIVYLPDGGMLVTERPGRIRLIDKQGRLEEKPVATLGRVKEIGEGGLLGIVLHPDFSVNSLVYVYYTYAGDGDKTLNRVARFTYKDGYLTGERVIVDDIPGAPNHNGGRVKFGPDGFLYITTGDAQQPSLAQNTSALAGKVLRVTDEGRPAPGNPFGNLVYSYGHRNPQGLAWDDRGRLWSTEHGRSGVQSGLDEINLVEAGKNYGWPDIGGDDTRARMESPKLHSGAVTWAPAGAAWVDSSLFFGGLRGEALYEAVIRADQVAEVREHFQGRFGRIREVIMGPDNRLYLTTSNRDGRGNPEASDDKIIRVNPRGL